MEGYGSYTNFLFNGEDDGVAGMEDGTIPTTQNILSEVDVEMLAVQRDPRGQKILIPRKMKLYAQAS
jgi:hypothetical protein